ncbi:MAG: hypothetical protein ACLUD2_00970 [Clostridium sp.]
MIRILLWTIIGDFLVTKYCAYIHNALYYPKRRYKYMQEFDFTNTDMADDLSEMAEHLSQEEATAAIAAIKALRDGKENTEAEDFKNWFDSALPADFKGFCGDYNIEAYSRAGCSRGYYGYIYPVAAVLTSLRIRGGCI